MCLYPGFHFRFALKVSAEKREDKGFILIAVLWVSLVLSVVAMNAATSSRLQGIQVQNILEIMKQEHLLYSGLARGKHEYLKYEANRALAENREIWEVIAGEGLDLWHPRFEPYEIRVEDVPLAVQIRDVHGRLNINNVQLYLLEEILGHCGVQGSAEISATANSILDWIDEDDLQRPGGAEKDYYLSLPSPYLPKNAQIQDMRELLLVKGVNRHLLYGTDDHPGLIHFFHVYGEAKSLDINSASPETFVLAGLDADSVQEIVDKRNLEPISRLAQLGEVLPPGVLDEVGRYYTVQGSGQALVSAFILLEDGRQGAKISGLPVHSEQSARHMD